jgi:DNA-binding CsgD family transcriptional regulator
MLEDARAGRSDALVIRGDPGVGKTALMRYVADQATGFRVARIGGVESEMELAYAGLHQLCAPMLERLDVLPRPQADALCVAFGLAVGDPPGRFLVGLATLSLVAAAAHEEPLLCLVDDFQWLDDASVQVLGFVARRLLAERVALVFAVREPTERRELAGLPELWLDGLDGPDARALLASALAGPIDPGVRERIITETRGNPLALLELARGSTPAELAGGFAMPAATALSDSIEESFRRRLEVLPADTRRLVVLAAADPVGEPMLVWRAAEQLGISPEAAGPATEVGLLEFGARVRFRHPLVRSAAYRSASLPERHTVHGALAQVTDQGADPDRRAWHLAQATLRPDEQVAIELERSADRAQRRGGLAAAAAFLERAAALTPARSRRAARLLAAAAAKREAGALDAAVALLSAVETDTLDEVGRARSETLRGQLAFDHREGREASRLLTDAARRLEPLDVDLARKIHLEAVSAAMWVGDRDGPGGVRNVAEAALQAPDPPGAPSAIDVLLDAFAHLHADGYRAAAPSLARALKVVVAAEDPTDDRGHWLWLTVAGSAVTVPQELWDAEAWHTVASRREQFARDTGALVQLQFALHATAWSCVLGGQFNKAALLIEEDKTLAVATGNPSLAYVDILLAAFRGEDERAFELIEHTAREAKASGLTRVISFADYASAVLHNGCGRHAAALDAARPVFERELAGYGPFVVPELAEAAARSGDAALLSSALDWIGERTRQTPTDWSLGIEARIRALMSDGSDADGLYLSSIEHLSRVRIRTELARAHLLYGEWLRRHQRRVDARRQLSTAHDMLDSIGMTAFAARARRELLATGANVRKRTVDTRDDLTAQELQIAQLARDGLSNPEIGAKLFLSPRTVEWHLRKVFGKLGIGSRRELRQALPSSDLNAAHA